MIGLKLCARSNEFRFIVNLNDGQEFQEGMIYIQRDDYKKEFAYNLTSETLPELTNIVQTSHEDTELGEYDAIAHIHLIDKKRF